MSTDISRACEAHPRGGPAVIKCIRFRRYTKNTLRGFADFELTGVGLILRDCTWHVHGNGREWIAFPARPFESSDGTKKWSPLIEFGEHAAEARKRFQKQALEAVHGVADTEEAAS